MTQNSLNGLTHDIYVFSIRQRGVNFFFIFIFIFYDQNQ